MDCPVHFDNILVRKNPCCFLDEIELDITFTVSEVLGLPLEWRVLYVGSAVSEEYDQVLDQFEIGPVTEPGSMNFTLSCHAPDFRLIPRDEILSVTALILTVSYARQQFIRVGYYVHNAVPEENQLPDLIHIHAAELESIMRRTVRTILTDKPRITRFRINWNESAENSKSLSQQQQIIKQPLASQEEQPNGFLPYETESNNGSQLEVSSFEKEQPQMQEEGTDEPMPLPLSRTIF